MDWEDFIHILTSDEPDMEAAQMGAQDLRTASEGANARIAELEQEVADLQAKYTETAARNWELMQAVTVPAGEGGEGDPEPEPEPEPEGEEFDDLFEEE